MKFIVLLFFITVSIFAKVQDNKLEMGSITKDVLDGKELKISEEILKYFTIEGYFRTSANYRSNFDLNAFSLMNPDTTSEYVVGSSRHMPSIDELKNGIASESVVSYNTRFRFSPNIIVGEYLRAVATFDIFDNKLYGDNENSMIFAKEAYFEGKTPLGLISLGRMATDWGLGMYRNSGKGKFANYGDYIDQIKFKVVDFVGFMPNLSLELAYEIKNSSANNNAYFNNMNTNSDYDIEDRDDYVGFSLYLQDKMEGNELNNYLSRGNSRLNYGLYAGMYWQDKVTTVITPKTDENGNTINENVSLISYESSSLDYYTLDAFFEFYFKNDFNIKAEVAYIVGTNENDDSFNQWGIAFQSNVNFLMNTLVAGVDFGIASADTSSDSDPYKTIGQKIDYKKDNFTFNPDYDIDLIFFKEINFISNLYYIRPHISWLATENISLNLWSVTSIAFNEEQTYGRDTYLGTELDTSIEYLNKDGLNFGIRGGIFIPGAGMDWLGTDGERGGAVTELKDSIADLAFTIQAFLVMKF